MIALEAYCIQDSITFRTVIAFRPSTNCQPSMFVLSTLLRTIVDVIYPPGTLRCRFSCYVMLLLNLQRFRDAASSTPFLLQIRLSWEHLSKFRFLRSSPTSERGMPNMKFNLSFSKTVRQIINCSYNIHVGTKQWQFIIMALTVISIF